MKRPALWIVCAMICGIYFRLGESLWICLVCICCLLIGSYHCIFVYKRKQYMVLLLATIFGFLLTNQHIAPTFVDQAGGSMQIQANGVVLDIGTTSGGYPKLTVVADVTCAGNGAMFPKQKLYIIDTNQETYQIGDCVAITGEALSFSRAEEYGGYDEWLQLRILDYDAKLFPSSITKTGKKVQTIQTAFFEVNAAVQQKIEQCLPTTESGIAKAMLTGEKDDLTPEIEYLYTRAGVTHILCISGLHMSILGAGVVLFLQQICKSSIRMTAIGTICMCGLFLVFSGCSVSAMRAFCMILIACLGRLVYRRHEWLNSIALAALCILCIQPLYLYHVGFQLSFLSVLGIYVGASVLPIAKTWYGKILNLAGISAFASVFGLPVVAYHFYFVSTVSVLSNMVILPLSGILLASILFSVLLSFLYFPFGIFCAGTAYAILKVYEFVCVCVTKIPYAYVCVGRPSVETILLCYALLLFIFVCRCCKWEKIGIGICTTCLLLGMVRPKQNTVAFLNVGQSACTVITTSDNTVVVIYDGGWSWAEEGKNTAEQVLLPYLYAKGFSHIDALFLTQTEQTTGTKELLSGANVYMLYVTQQMTYDTQYPELKEQQIPIQTISFYEGIQGNSFGTLVCIYPQTGTYRYTYGEIDILLTGMLNDTQELQLVQNDIPLQSEIVQVSQYGTKGSIQQFVTAVSPEQAIVSCDGTSLYQKPDDEILQRWEDIGATIYRTDTTGSIFVELTETGYQIQPERATVYERIQTAMAKGTPF